MSDGMGNEVTLIGDLKHRCAVLRNNNNALKAMLAGRREAVVRLKERLDSLRTQLSRLQEANNLAEGNKGKLEQTYYDLYFQRMDESVQFSRRIAAIRDSLTEPSSVGVARALDLLNELELKTPIEIPTLRPYPRLRVDLGLAEGCSDFCMAHRRRMTGRMSNAFAGTRVNAILDLSEYGSAADYRHAVHKKTKGNVSREIRRSEVLGLFCRTFNPDDYLDDIDFILRSAPERQAGVLRPPYDKGAESFLNYVRANHPNRSPLCPRHHNSWHGIFQQDANGDRLLGFIMVERHGQFGHYRHIMGHNKWLTMGLMYQLHFNVVDWIFSSQPGLIYVSYAQWTDLPDEIDVRPGLTRWKKKTLFKPTRLIEILHGRPEDLRSEVLERSSNKGFPEYVLNDAGSAVCLYSAALSGVRDVIHVAQRGILDVTLVDHDHEMMAELQKIYPESWNYHVGDAFAFIREKHQNRHKYDVVILDPWVYLEKANINIIKLLIGIANRYILISVTDIHFFRQNHIRPVADEAYEFFHSLDDRVKSVDVVLSTRAFGGLYWCVLKLIDDVIHE